MANLVLELKPGEMLVINGATIRFRSRTRIELLSRARFLFGKQIMAPHEANTLARQLYFALQIAYVGSDEERGPALAEFAPVLAKLRDRAEFEPMLSDLDAVADFASAGDYYMALKLGRNIIRHEDVMLNGQVDGGR